MLGQIDKTACKIQQGSGSQLQSWGPTALLILYVFLFNTPDSDYKLIRKQLHKLNRVCQIRERELELGYCC